ncbi:MAG: hypothetical protein K2K82_01395 [Muribaculaceae bacterium]|nr:hypothetical protein [Muribaculaceae bacterium]
MNYRQAKIVSRTIIFLIVLLAIFGLYRCIKSDTTTEDTVPDDDTPTVTQKKKERPRVTNLSDQFNDLNDAHVEYAVKFGIQPIETLKDIMAINKAIVEVKSGKEYFISPLTHSYAFLVEPAARLLHDIGSEFNQRLAEVYPGADYQINATSLLRTTESVSRLKKGNVNSTENSAHLYGTTFDVSYVKFHEGEKNSIQLSDADLKILLAEVLLGLKEEGRCLVKYERKQGCFHITSTGK